MAGFHSRFGGLWIDDVDQNEVQKRLGAISDDALRLQVGDFIRNGYVIIRGAVDTDDIDNYLRAYETAADSSESFDIEVPTQGGRQKFSRVKATVPGAKILDSVMLLPSGQKLSFARPITAFLQTIFEENCLAFQSLHFEVGSTQAIHQDTAYVVVKEEPVKLAASWIALEDVQPGSGELVYYPGGHRMTEYVYGKGEESWKHWNPDRDGNPVHDQHLIYLREEAARLEMKPASFLAKKGDALIWHADLPHGGGEITSPGLTRRSLVTHYCPLSRQPYYSDFIPPSWRQSTPAKGGNALMSLYYDKARLHVYE